MAIQQTVSINKEHIKFRWGEPYASDASNMQMGINDVGAYKGAIVSADGGTSVALGTEDGECLVLHRNPSDGITTVVRVPSAVIIDLSAIFPLAADTNLYFFMTVDYSINSETTGLWQVADDIGDIPAGAVRLGTAELLSGATGVEQENIRVDGTHRDKVLRKVYMRVPVRSIFTISSPTTRFKLTGKIYFMGNSTLVPNSEKMEFRGALSDFSDPLVGSDGGRILPGEWYSTDVSATPLDSGDMDLDGCFTDPWISFDFSDTVDASVDQSFSVVHWRCIPIEDIDNYNREFGKYGAQHATGVYAKDVTDSPDSLTNGTLTSQLEGLLGYINDRIKMVYPAASTGTPVLLWRSNNAVNDAQVDDNTISIYFTYRTFVICHGCYMNGSNSVYAQSAGDVRVIYYEDDGGIFHMHRVLSGGEYPTSLSIDTPSNWDEFQRDDIDAFYHYNIPKELHYEETVGVEMSGTPDTGDNEEYVQLFSVAGGRIRAYWGGSSSFDNCRFLITFGCRWDDGDSRWKPTTGYSGAWAWAISMENDEIKLLRQDTSDLDVYGGWGETNWTSGLIFHDGTDSPKLDGPSTNIRRAIFRVRKIDEHIRRMIDPDWVGPKAIGFVTFGLKLGGISATNISSVHNDGTLSDAASRSVLDSDWYSVTIESEYDIEDIADSITPIEFDTTGDIVLSGVTTNLAIGQWVAIRSPTSSNEGAWSIQSIAYSYDPPRTALTLLPHGSGPSTPTGSVTDEVMYYIAEDSAGDELWEQVTVTVEDDG